MSLFALARAPENRLARMFFAAAGAMLLLSTIATFAPPVGAQTECSLSVSFDNARLLNNGVDLTAGPFAIDLPAGTYTVVVVAYDSHDAQPNVGTQPNEQFRVVLDSGYTSPLTNDIPDDVNSSTTTFSGQQIGASSSMTIEHAAIGGVNSLNPLSVCFIDEGPSDDAVATEVEGAVVESCDASSGADGAAADGSEDCTEDTAEVGADTVDCTESAADDTASEGADASTDTCPADEATHSCDTDANSTAADAAAADGAEDCTEDAAEVGADTASDGTSNGDTAAADSDTVETEVQGVTVEATTDAATNGDTAAAESEIAVEVQGAVQLPATAQVDSAAQVDSGTAAAAQVTTGAALAATGAGDVWKILVQMSIVLMAMGALCTRWVRFA